MATRVHEGKTRSELGISLGQGLMNVTGPLQNEARPHPVHHRDIHRGLNR